ncbi:glycosyltransferase [Candidatus Microgenomates bacterium]|nr:glycosyltransferase [Candidatus Microgenomates bacterium]
MRNSRKPRIAIYADPLMGNSGASKVTIDLANALDADIITAGFNKDLAVQLNKTVKVHDIGNLTITKNHPVGFLFEAPLRFIFCPRYDYDIKMFIGLYSIYASRRDDNNIWFSFTPNRIMYDLKEWKLKNATLFRGLMLRLHIALFKAVDQKVVKNNFAYITAQTQVAQKRIKKYYSKNAEIVYSPVKTSNFHFATFSDYYLSVSRLSQEKRVDLIVKAFKQLPNQKLLVVGEGPEKEKIMKLIGDSKNISLKDSVNDKELIGLYANCLATIYMPIDEDYGLVPVEGMASGKACIASDEGGCRETVIEGNTGYLIKPTVDEIVKTVRAFNLSKAKKMKIDCIMQAKEFDISVCVKRLQIIFKTIPV